jgi:AraC family chitin signaling transcriptional activator
MQDLYLEKNLQKRDLNIKRLIHVIDNEISTKKDLEVFDTNFNAVHEEFIRNLKKRFPKLNQNDHRLCTFIKMNKSTKEIATLLNMSIRGVETSRYRLRKKMGLDSNSNLYDTISDI